MGRGEVRKRVGGEVARYVCDGGGGGWGWGWEKRRGEGG